MRKQAVQLADSTPPSVDARAHVALIRTPQAQTVSEKKRSPHLKYQKHIKYNQKKRIIEKILKSCGKEKFHEWKLLLGQGKSRSLKRRRCSRVGNEYLIQIIRGF